MKDGVIPSIFPNTPSYLSTTANQFRSTSKATASRRFEQEITKLNCQEKSFKANDDISNISLLDIKSRLTTEAATPSGFSMAHIDEVLQIYLLGITDDVLVVKPCSQSLELQLQIAVQGLQKYFSNLSDDHEKFQKIQFIIELLE